MPGAELFVFSAPSPTALAAALDENRRQLEAAPPGAAPPGPQSARPDRARDLGWPWWRATSTPGHVAGPPHEHALHDAAAPKERIAPKSVFADGPAPGRPSSCSRASARRTTGWTGWPRAFPDVCAQWFHDMDTLLAVVEPHAVASADGQIFCRKTACLHRHHGHVRSHGARLGRYHALAGHSNGENAALVASGKMAFRSDDHAHPQ
ncbi:MAG: hypothetical protein R2854_04540 [Caldilineaceae bacterium]